MTKRDFPPIHPGEILFKDFLKPLQISQHHLAQAISVPPRHINEDEFPLSKTVIRNIERA